MFETDNSQINVDELMTKIRAEAARRNQNNGGTAVNADSSQAKINWPNLDADLKAARQHAHIGASLPSFAHYRGPVRLVARFASRLVLFLSSFITGSQRQFNASALQIFSDLYDELKKLEKELIERDERISVLAQRQMLLESRIDALLQEADARKEDRQA